MKKFIQLFFVRLKLYLTLRWDQLKRFFSRQRVPKLLRSRRAVMAVYVVIMVSLATVWWWGSPYRLRNATPVPLPLVGIDADNGMEATSPERDEPTPGTDLSEAPQEEDWDEEDEVVAVVAQPVLIEALRKPIEGPLSAKYGFGWSSTFGDYRWHHGIGIGSTQGTQVTAAFSGTVLAITTNDLELGSSVTLQHGSNWKTVYANLGRITVSVGQEVTAGQPLGQLGPNAPLHHMDKPQLFFALYKDGESVDPAPFFN